MASNTRGSKKKRSELPKLNLTQIADDADFPEGLPMQSAREEDIPWIESLWPEHIPHGMLPITTAAIRCGFRLPLHPFIMDVLNYLQLPIYALFPSGWLCFVAFLYYSAHSGMMPSLDNFFTFYGVSTRTGTGKLSGRKLFYFHDRARGFSLVDKEDSLHAWSDHFFWVMPVPQGESLESIWGVPLFVTPVSGLMRGMKKVTPRHIKKVFRQLTPSSGLLSRSELLEPSLLRSIFTPPIILSMGLSNYEETSSSSQLDHRRSGSMVKRSLIHKVASVPSTQCDGGIFPSDPATSPTPSATPGDGSGSKVPFDPNSTRPYADSSSGANKRHRIMASEVTPFPVLDDRVLSFLNSDSEIPKVLSVLMPSSTCTVGDLIDKPLSHAVELVKQTKLKVRDPEYVRSFIDHVSNKTSNIDLRLRFTSSDISRLGVERFDFGWGKPISLVSAIVRSTMIFYQTCNNNGVGDDEMMISMRAPQGFEEELKRMMISPR